MPAPVVWRASPPGAGRVALLGYGTGVADGCDGSRCRCRLDRHCLHYHHLFLLLFQHYAHWH